LEKHARIFRSHRFTQRSPCRASPLPKKNSPSFFPEYYSGKSLKPNTEPGTIRLQPQHGIKPSAGNHLRNGPQRLQKSPIVTGHGGNESLLPFFAHPNSISPRYVVYIQSGERHIAHHPLKTTSSTCTPGNPKLPTLWFLIRSRSPRPRQAGSGATRNHDPLPETVYTGIWWYARFPDHYSGEGSTASKELGEAGMNNWIATIEDAIRAVKADDASLKTAK